MIPVLLMNLSLLVLNGLRTINLTGIKSYFRMDFQANHDNSAFLDAASKSSAKADQISQFIFDSITIGAISCRWRRRLLACDIACVLL